MAVTPTTVGTNSTGNSFTFTFTAGGNGNMNGGSVSLDIPAGWTAPQVTSSTSAGFITATSGSCVVTASPPPTLVGRTFTASVTSCSTGQTFTITYSSVTAPNSAGTSTFITKTKANSGSGTLTAIPSSPVVTVGGKSNQTVTFTSTAPARQSSVTHTRRPRRLAQGWL